MIMEISSWILFIANLTHDKNLRAFTSNMLLELSTCHMLKFFTVANIATEFRAVELSMGLQFTQSFPYDFVVSMNRWTSMWEFTKINTVLENFIYLLKKITFGLTVRTTNIIIRSLSLSILIVAFSQR